jgi:hypothetical protein
MPRRPVPPAVGNPWRASFRPADGVVIVNLRHPAVLHKGGMASCPFISDARHSGDGPAYGGAAIPAA